MGENIPKFDLSKVGRTNLYHSDEERRLIDKAICRITETLQRVCEEKRAIILREEALQSELDRYLSARAPIKRLPDNVLCNIFEWHCALPVEIPFSSSSFPPQITISHVCSTWRQIMLHIPAFWSNIRLEFDMTRDSDIGKKVDVAHALLFRAKSLPCNVKIWFWNDSLSEPDQCQLDCDRNVVKDIVSLFKVKTLEITFDFYHLQDLLQLPNERLCYIENLRIRSFNTPTSKITLPFELHKLSSLTSFSVSNPLLQIPYIFDINDQDGSWFASIPWHQLRHIDIRMTFPMPFCLRILELSSVVLETCSLDVYVDSSITSSPLLSIKEPVQCSQLRDLKVIVHSSSATDSVPESDDIIIDPFLCSLQCPQLKSLEVGSIESLWDGIILPTSINVQTFLRMQHVSGMHLEELTIYDTTHDLEVLPLLASFPSLRRLGLPPTINFTEEVMDQLSSGTIAPCLEYLTFNRPAPVSKKIFQMIKTRSCVGKEDNTREYKISPFKTVILHCEGSEQKKYSDTIKEIKESGVQLMVFWERYGSDDDLKLNSDEDT